MNSSLARPPFGLIVVTQALLGVLFAVCCAAVVFLPGFSESIAASRPEYADLRAPLLALAVAFMILALVALAMISLLVHRIHRETVLARSSVLWVDVIVGSLAGAVVLVIVGFFVISGGQAGSPFLALVQAMSCVALIVMACVALVLRSLLWRAIQLRAELDEVV